jgi:choline kinase
MKGIILAAGKGLRLNGASGNTPKCLIKIGECSLLERQVHSLRALGIEDIVVIVGYEAERVQQSCDAAIRFVKNPFYEQTNSLMSLWLARDYLSEGFVVLNSDVLFHPQLLARLLHASCEDALLIESCETSLTPLGDEEMKVQVEAGRVIDISKTLDSEKVSGENLGIVKFGPSGAQLLIRIMDDLIARGHHGEWAPRAFCEFAAQRPLHALETEGYPWIEIDFPEDLHKAVHEIYPDISEPAAAHNSTAPRFTRFAQVAEVFP